MNENKVEHLIEAEGQELRDDYLSWFKAKTEVVLKPNMIEISLPFANCHCEDLCLYIEKIGEDEYEISDAEEVFYSQDREEESFAQDYKQKQVYCRAGLKLRAGKELFLQCNKADFPRRFHAFVEAMIELNGQ